MSRYNLGGDSTMIHRKVTVNKMTKEECQKLDIPVYFHVCEYGHKLRYVSNDKCVDCSVARSRKHTNDAKRVAIKKRLEELEARRELEALDSASTHTSATS